MRLKSLLLTLAILFSCSIAKAQTTVVTGNVTDQNSQVWAAGSITWTTTALGVSPVKATLDGSGNYTVTIPHNSATAAVGEVWTAISCPAVGVSWGCPGSLARQVSGAAQVYNF